MVVNVHEAKTQLSKLLAQVERGEEVIIARAGVPVARLTRFVGEPRPPRKLGAMKGRIWVASDFDETSDEIINSFYGEQDTDS